MSPEGTKRRKASVIKNIYGGNKMIMRTATPQSLLLVKDRNFTGVLAKGKVVYTRSLGKCVIIEKRWCVEFKQNAYWVDRPDSYSDKPVRIFESEILPLAATL